MNLSPYPLYTKQTKCNNNLNTSFDNRNDFLRPKISNPSIPIQNNHDHYLYDPMINNINVDDGLGAAININNERFGISTRNTYIDQKRNPVQNSFQHNYTMEFSNMSNLQDNEINKYLIRNPVNTRRDNIEKIRNSERQDFLNIQGKNDFHNLRFENTRKDKIDLNSSKYIPMAKTMAIPKENV